MKIKLGKTIEEIMAREQWHEWFAWHPVFIGHTLVWLENIYKKGTN